MPILLKQFLDERGFQQNPFATTNAEQETDLLSAFFVRAAWFDQLVGDPHRPESLILYAPQDHGKTSHRIELARRAGGHPQAPALVVTLNDLSVLLRGGLDQIGLDTYIVLVRRLCLEALDTRLQQSNQHTSQLQQEGVQWTLYCALLHLYARRRALGRPISAAVQEQIDVLKHSDPGPRECLKELSAVARAAGFASVYVLLDGIDELHETKSSSNAMLRLISPLIEAPGLLQECGFAFKFFLPLTLEAPMRTNEIGRLDRIPTFTLAWTTEQLCDMLSKRLETHSLIGSTNPAATVSRFADLCAVSYDVDHELAAAAETSPRHMLDLARRIVVDHCARANNPKHLIGEESIKSVLSSAPNPWKNMALRTETAQAVSTVAPARVEVPLLHLNERGEVWLGERSKDEPLTPLLRKCLVYLWTHRHRNVSYVELQRELYGADWEQRGDPQSSIEKLVRRLRAYLEPERSSSHHYIDVQAGFGYVLRNFRDK